MINEQIASSSAEARFHPIKVLVKSNSTTWEGALVRFVIDRRKKAKLPVVKDRNGKEWICNSAHVFRHTPANETMLRELLGVEAEKDPSRRNNRNTARKPLFTIFRRRLSLA